MVTGPNAYDEVPYDNLAFAQTHPDRLATTARMFGLEPPPIATARVLELGCASGGNLLPMAFNLPDGEFVGIDLSRRHVDTALSTVRALGMRNIRIVHGSILDVDETWGLFDYIICHGVFSWVEPQVQDSILRIAADNLVENGIAYISYNTYPGWHMREMVRHMMRYHTRQFEESQEQIEQARALLGFLAASVDAQGAYGQLLQDELDTLRHSGDSYLFHEHLEQTNAPIYFHEFMERVGHAGLQYLCETDLAAVMSQRFPAPVAETLERISPDILHLEQYMDFVRNRRFRQTLLCHAAVTPKRALSPSVLHGLLASCHASTDERPNNFELDTTTVFRVGERRIETRQPVTKAAFTVLMERWPRAIDVDELCRLAIELAAAADPTPTAPDRMRRALMEELFTCLLAGVIELHTFQPAFANVVTDRPRANALAAHQLETRDTAVNTRHQTVRFDELTRAVARLADGRRTRVEIVDVLVQRVASGAVHVNANDQTVSDVDTARPLLIRAVEEALASLARAALLVE